MPQKCLDYSDTVSFLEKTRGSQVADGMKAKSFYSCLVAEMVHELLPTLNSTTTLIVIVS